MYVFALSLMLWLNSPSERCDQILRKLQNLPSQCETGLPPAWYHKWPGMWRSDCDRQRGQRARLEKQYQKCLKLVDTDRKNSYN